MGWGPGGILELEGGAPGGNAGLGLRQSLILRSLSGGGRGGWRAHRGCREEGRWESWEAWNDEGCGRWGDKGKGVKVNVAQACPTLVTPWAVARQAPLSMGFSRQVAIPFLGDLPDPGIEPGSPVLQADSLLSEPPVQG